MTDESPDDDTSPDADPDDHGQATDGSGEDGADFLEAAGGTVKTGGPSGDPQLIPHTAPSMSTTRFGWLGELWASRKYLKKREKIASKGYVQWFLVDDSFPRPMFVKPERKGGGIPEYEVDGQTYLFPKEAMVPSEERGIWTIVHRRGEADPINVRERDELSIPTDELKEYLTMRVSSSPPSLLDRFDWDTSDILKAGIAIIIVYAIISGGGII